ncbi:RING/U-box superfamily protein [Cucumis melo var. makuwa]|uniref:RING/U-box superfamily protein n=1 Tax=Cucumis melo var. makuwa TaxID=1194695 RepID=A0A5A7TMG4_CUCMM|nr:RING/U-box superfamily protein [Cucumis melo var. makuwa]TYK29528.1 RING/U-box superfamily protein [Cucumis melo var. makuwa]
MGSNHLQLCRRGHCGHLFHGGCIAPWLRLNPSCPVRRTSLVPTPISTPLVEVVPLAIGKS